MEGCEQINTQDGDGVWMACDGQERVRGQKSTGKATNTDAKMDPGRTIM